ncbi:MAG: hypothetical protein ACJAQT_002319 [Akkermansiaceae bacterium]|jgi:hypothetical protein
MGTLERAFPWGGVSRGGAEGYWGLVEGGLAWLGVRGQGFERNYG